jgi:hypothetical protein
MLCVTSAERGQVHFIHHSPGPPADKLRDGCQDRATDGGAKPDGLWFSVGDGADWRALCAERAKTAGWSLDCLNYRTEISFVEYASILWIENAAGIDCFTAKYAEVRDDGKQSIKWDRVAEEFGGIIIAPLCHERRDYEQTRWYACWECSSGCVWRGSAIQSLRPLNY